MKIEDKTCSNCKYATEYVPYYTFPAFSPRCSKGHGQCKPDKTCNDWVDIHIHNQFRCGRCAFFKNNDCPYKEILKEDDIVLTCKFFVSVDNWDNEYEINQWEDLIRELSNRVGECKKLYSNYPDLGFERLIEDYVRIIHNIRGVIRELK